VSSSAGISDRDLSSKGKDKSLKDNIDRLKVKDSDTSLEIEA